MGQLSKPTTAPGAAAIQRAAARGRLELRGVSRGFAPGSTPALQGVTLICEPGEFVVVVGPSGCGKTTLLNLAAGLDRPTTGDVLIDGRPVVAPGPDRAVVFQEPALFPWMTAADNVELGLRIRGLPLAERRERAARALKLVHLHDAGRKLPHELSGGMRQRVAIARALVMDPAVLLMDEPFSALDAQTRTLLHEQMQEIWSETHKTILFVTHSVGEAVRLADRVIVLHANPGRIRREVRVEIPHPRDFDSPEISETVGIIRREIEDEVNRINAAMA
ncbi:MAG: ABC transporter ATP-binding protein [Phycisphaerae bacterium]